VVTIGSTPENQKEVQAGVVGVVAQNYPLFPHRTIIGNLTVAARQTGLDQKTSHEKAMDYLNRFELADKAPCYPPQLSGGQRQRIAIIQQLLCSEYFLIMDEPFTGLDPLMKDKVCDLINQVASLHEHNTIFIIAHDIPAVCGIADHLWLLGKDRDPLTNDLIPGATLQAQYNLVDLDLAWRPGISSTPRFASFVEEIKAQFKNL